MTRRDLAWRSVGIAAFVGATTLGLAVQRTDQSVLGLPAFCLALLGIVLIVQGRRVPAALRIERSRHRALAQAIRDRRRQQPADR